MSLRERAAELVRAGDYTQAELLLQHAVRDAPGEAGALRDLGVVLGGLGRWPEATRYLRRACAANPGDAGLLAEFGLALLESGEAEAARRVLEQARRLAPGHVGILYRAAKAAWACGLRARALALVADCLAVDAAFAPALLRRGEWLIESGFGYEAAEPLLRYIALRPDDYPARALAARAHWCRGEIEECLALTRSVIEAGAATAAFRSTHIGVQLHRVGETRASLRETALAWQRAARPAAAPVMRVRGAAARRAPRVGYLTHEFAQGAGFHFLIPLLRDGVYVYHTNPRSDAWTRRARRRVRHWRASTDAGELAATIAADGIDVLVDLSGHYGTHLAMFQSRHAPVQIAFPDYPSTTGAAAMDYILTDRWVCPVGWEDQYTEKAIRLPQGYLPYEPPSSPRIAGLPAMENGYVTLGLLQRPAKMNPAVWDVLAEVMRAVRGSRLLVHYHAAELDRRGSGARMAVIAELESRGVAAARVRFRGEASLEDHLALFGGIDIALDTFPYNGQTTTCECLWMGVPVVTLCGETHAGRVGYEILDRAGLGELVGESAGQYVEIAARLARDLPALARMRRRLRGIMRRSPMVNGATVRGIEAAYRELQRARG